MSTTPHPNGRNTSASSQSAQPDSRTQASDTSPRDTGIRKLPPEYEAILVAAREIEKDYVRETEKTKDLQEKIRESRDRLSEMEKKMNDRFEERFDTLEGEMVAFRRQMSDLQALIRAFVEKAGERDKESFNAECERLRSELGQNREELARLQRELEQSRGAAETLRAELETRAGEAADIASAAELEKVRAEAQKTVSELKLKIEELVEERRQAKVRARIETRDLEKKADQIRDESARTIARLRESLEEATKRADILDRAIRNDVHVQRAQEELREHKARFMEIADVLKAEVEYLRKIFPLRAMLKVKNAEIDRFKKMLKRLRFDHPDRPEIENIVKEQIRERDAVRAQIDEAERLFDQQVRRVNDSVQHVKGAGILPAGEAAAAEAPVESPAQTAEDISGAPEAERAARAGLSQ